MLEGIAGLGRGHREMERDVANDGQGGETVSGDEKGGKKEDSLGRCPNSWLWFG